MEHLKIESPSLNKHIKHGDTATPIKLQLIRDGEGFDLSNSSITDINVTISNRSGIILEKNIDDLTVQSDGFFIFNFEPEDLLDIGEKRVEVLIKFDNDTTKVFPSEGAFVFYISKTEKTAGTIISFKTIDEVKADLESYTDGRVKDLENTLNAALENSEEVEYVTTRQEVQNLSVQMGNLSEEQQSVVSQLAEKANQSDLSQTITDVDSTNLRIDELVIASGSADAEVTDAHVSTVKNKAFTTLRNRLEGGEEDSLSIENLMFVKDSNFYYRFGSISSTDGKDSEPPVTTRLRTKFLKVKQGTKIENLVYKAYLFNVYTYDLNKVYISSSGFLSQKEYVFNSDCYIRLVIRKSNEFAEMDALDKNVLDFITLIHPTISYAHTFTYAQNSISSTDGTDSTYASTARIRSNFIYCEKGTILKNTAPSTFKFNVYKYDLAKGYITSTGFLTQSEYTVDETCLVRLVFGKQNDTALIPSEAEGVILINPIEPINEKPFSYELSGVSSANGVDSYTPSTNRLRTNLVRVFKGNSLLVDDVTTYNYTVYHFDSNLNYVSNTGWIANVEYSFESNGYVRLVVKRVDESELTNAISDISNKIQIRVNSQDLKVPNNTEVNPLQGKVLLNFGDSIAADYAGYARVITNRNGMTLHMYAVGGATVANVVEKPRIQEQVDQAKAEGKTADYILFDGGTNDAIEGRTTAGTITAGYNDVLDENTFCGAFEKLCKSLKLNWLGKKLIYIRVHNMDSRTDLQKTYGDLAVEICKKWSIPVVDLYHEGGLNSHIPELKKAYTQSYAEKPDGDGTHPNADGHQIFYVPPIEAKMKSV